MLHRATMAGSLGTYIFQLWKKAAKGSVLLTDTMSIVTIPIVTVGYWALKESGFISSNAKIEVSELVSIVVLFAISGMIIFRFLASPYLLWRDQNQMIATLETRLAEPEMIERRLLAEHIAKSRADLVKNLAIMIKLSMDEYLWREHQEYEGTKLYQDIKVKRIEQFQMAQEHAYFSINELAHMPEVGKLGYDFSNACDRLIMGYKEGDDTRPVKKELYDYRDSLFPLLYNR